MKYINVLRIDIFLHNIVYMSIIYMYILMK